MGVGISLDHLAGAVAACGGMGTISTALCGYQEPDFAADPRGANLRALARQVKAAKAAAKGAGMVHEIKPVRQIFEELYAGGRAVLEATNREWQ